MTETIDRTTGRVIGRAERLRQSVQTILNTPKGSCVMRRDFGSRLFQLIDAPVTPSWLTLAYAESAGAIAKWEPDITVTGFQATSSSPGRVTLTIECIDSLTGSNLQLTGIKVNG